MLASLADPPYLQRVVAAVAEGRREYAELARSLGLSTLPSAANFVAIDVGEAGSNLVASTSLPLLPSYSRRAWAVTLLYLLGWLPGAIASVLCWWQFLTISQAES